MDTPDGSPDVAGPPPEPPVPVASAPAPAADETGQGPDPSPPAAEAMPVTFTGQGGEYFRIWIVNVALTILTLGIFSAWAKVRRLQYFHRHTHVAGASFDYHGDPVAILKGRIVGGVLFAAYTFAGYVSPIAALATAAVIGCVMPWMLARSLRFRLRNTSYRGLTFDFTGSTRSAYWVYFALPIFTLFTFGLLGPLWHHRMKRFQYDHTRWGNAAFRTTAQTQDFYVAYIFAAMIGMVMGGALAALIGGMTAAMGVAEAAGDGAPPSTAATVVVLVAVFGIYLLGLMTMQAFLTTRLRNVVWNATSAAGFTFTSRLETGPMLWIVLTNLAATIGTLGLFWPYAQVRVTRYLAQGLTMQGTADFSHVEARDTAWESALGDEVAGIFDFDIAF